MTLRSYLEAQTHLQTRDRNPAKGLLEAGLPLVASVVHQETERRPRAEDFVFRRGDSQALVCLTYTPKIQEAQVTVTESKD